MELRDVGRLVWKHHWTVLLVFIATVAIGTAFVLITPKRYESTATIALTPDAAKGPEDSLSPSAVASLVGTYAVTAKSRSIVQLAETKLGYKLPGTLSTSPRLETGILQVSDRASSPQAAAAAAAAIAVAFIESLAGNGLVDAKVVTPATVDTTPVQPQPQLVIGIAIFLGLVAGCTLALGLDHFRQRVETADDVAEVVDVPVLGHLPYKRSMARNAKSIVWDSPELADIQESMRALRTNLQLLGADAPRSILVTSSTAAQGKSTLVVNLGIALSQAGINTIIVDADMRNPRQHELFGLANDQGLSTVLQYWGASARTSRVQAQQTHYERLSTMTAGPTFATSTELLYTRFRAVLAELLRTDSLVLIDSPPLLPVADARIIAAEVDATIMVVNARSERPWVLRSAVEKLRLADATVTGIVLNQAAEAEAPSYYPYYGAVRI